MDILKKMFKNTTGEDEQPKKDKDTTTTKDEFRKPQWFEEAETDDELFDDDRKFAFQIFTNPMELQKHFERQMQQILESINEMEENGVKMDKNLKEDFLKPGFEDSFRKELDREHKNVMDTDLDGEIYADQLHTLIQRLNPGEKELPNVLPRNDSPKRQLQLNKKKLTDEEIIMGKIHGTLLDEQGTRIPRATRPRPGPDMMTPITPMLPRSASPFGGVFEGTYQGPKMFRQSVVSKTVRKPDGSYETTKITEDSHGNRRTTITRTVDGKSETVTTYDGFGGAGSIKQKQDDNPEMQSYSNRNIFVTKEGYAMPRNLW